MRHAAGGLALALTLLAAPLAARDSLGVFGDWGAFRDPALPRCYAIALPRRGGAAASFAAIGFWPDGSARGQVNLRFSGPLDTRRAVVLMVGDTRFILAARGANAWAQTPQMDAAIVAAMRDAAHMGVGATGARGQRLTAGWALGGAATAIDAAALGCARSRD